MSIIKQLENTKSNLQSLMALITGKVVSDSTLKKKRTCFNWFYHAHKQEPVLQGIYHLNITFPHFYRTRDLSDLSQEVQRRECILYDEYEHTIASEPLGPKFIKFTILVKINGYRIFLCFKLHFTFKDSLYIVSTTPNRLLFKCLPWVVLFLMASQT